MLDFRDVVAVRSVDSRWRAVAVGDRAFATEREKRKDKALWYADVRESAKREREAKAKRRNELWLKERGEEQVLLASTNSAVVANKKWLIAAFIAMLIGCTLSVTLGVMLYFLL
jgi:Na+/melibiose symporter-like transporter